MRVSFLGLGVMGYPMAGHLKSSGHKVTVFNRTTSKAKEWVDQHGGGYEVSIEAACSGADIVFACVGNDNDIDAVASAAFKAMKPGALFIDHTTASAVMARHLAKQAHTYNLRFIDAPVSGGQAGAEQGQLTIMCGGAPKDFSEAEPILLSYAKYCGLIGNVGSGQLAKMVNQVAIAGLVQGLSEALDFGVRSGLDMEKVLPAIKGGAAGSWQMSNRGTTMLVGEFEFGFAVDWMRKDLAMIIEEAERIGATLEVTRLVDTFYAEVQRQGGGRWDTSSLIQRLKP
ncbi:MAG: NAD(P)-dependent oxidoreductase [Alphaproteobacteria bacterium]